MFSGQPVVVHRDGSWHRAKVREKIFNSVLTITNPQVGSPPGPDGRVEVHLVDLGSTSVLPVAALRTGVHSQLSQVLLLLLLLPFAQRGEPVKQELSKVSQF